MENVVKVALAKKLSDESKGIRLAPGNYLIDTLVTFRVKGVVDKSEDGKYKPTVNIPLKATLALVLEKAGFMREQMKALLIDAMRDALALQELGEDHVAERVNDIDAAMRHVTEITGNLAKQTRQGPTRVAVILEEIVPE